MIIRASRKNRFTVIPNDLIEDPALDWKDLGLLVYLLSKPDNWEISVEHLRKQRKMGRDAIYKCLDAIIDAGYARREKQRDGTIDWFIFDDKLTGESMEKPDTKPNPEKTEEALQSQILKSRITENPYYGKTDTNKDLINKQELNTKTKTEARALDDEKEVRPKKEKFIKPTLAEVTEYCVSENFTFDPSSFVDHFESNGWLVGKSKAPMKDWKAAVRNWSRRENKFNEQTQKSLGSATNRNPGSIGTKPTTRTIPHENFADKDYGQSTITAPWLTGTGIN
jgi:hypothetical protein